MFCFNVQLPHLFKKPRIECNQYFICFIRNCHGKQNVQQITGCLEIPCFPGGCLMLRLLGSGNDCTCCGRYLCPQPIPDQEFWLCPSHAYW